MENKELVITWQDVLSSKHKFYGYIGVLRDHALGLAYPYFEWNDRIYDTKTGMDTGVVSSQVK